MFLKSTGLYIRGSTKPNSLAFIKFLSKSLESKHFYANFKSEGGLICKVTQYVFIFYNIAHAQNVLCMKNLITTREGNRQSKRGRMQEFKKHSENNFKMFYLSLLRGLWTNITLKYPPASLQKGLRTIQFFSKSWKGKIIIFRLQIHFHMRLLWHFILV